MKKVIVILILLIGLTSYAQGGRRLNDRIKAQKTAFITEKLSLTSEEAEKFWPIYNAFDAKQDKIKSKDLKAIKIKVRSNPNMSDKEADELLSEILNAENELHTAKLQLVRDLKKVISPKKIIWLRAAEDEFNRKLIQRLKEFREKRKG